MSLLQFTNPTDIPAYVDNGQVVQPSVITLRTVDMLDVYERYLERHRRFHSGIPKHWPRYKEAQRIQELHAELAKALAEGRDITLTERDHIWAMSRDLMLELRFVSAHCPACARRYAPSECQVRSWHSGSERSTSIGRSVHCPMGHVLYTLPEWDT